MVNGLKPARVMAVHLLWGAGFTPTRIRWVKQPNGVRYGYRWSDPHMTQHVAAIIPLKEDFEASVQRSMLIS